jgi:uncharacterized membrane protein YqiK
MNMERDFKKELEAAQKALNELSKILLREGDVEGSYERQLAQAIRERDEARAEVERLRVANEALQDLVEVVAAPLRFSEQEHVAVVKLARRFLGGERSMRLAARLKDVAERQREACAKGIEDAFGHRPAASHVRATPLVTEEDMRSILSERKLSDL